MTNGDTSKQNGIGSKRKSSPHTMLHIIATVKILRMTERRVKTRILKEISKCKSVVRNAIQGHFGTDK